ERIRFILEDTGSHVVIVSDGTYECAQNLFNGQIILLNISDILKEYIGRCVPLRHIDMCQRPQRGA
ncbi:MAG: hypothetical protein II662_04400, partial [Bacteroidales bacterium]|nr:hypothetical protein [Bacteroidales bacterium]